MRNRAILGRRRRHVYSSRTLECDSCRRLCKQNYSEVRFARNMALLNMTQMDAAIVCWDIKYHYFNPRPTQLDPAIKTLTGIPNFPCLRIWSFNFQRSCRCHPGISDAGQCRQDTMHGAGSWFEPSGGRNSLQNRL